MSEVPHCPECERADTVTVRDGSQYEYYCRNCNLVIEPDDVTDAAWIDMVSDSMFTDAEAVSASATHDYSSECECDWCERGRPGIDDIPA
jgi:transcription initiation factor TFIIIB Brf1 subunit/transcription initiation factor TFIIB